MFARVQVHDTDDVLEELGALRKWLNAEDEFRGRVSLETAPVRPGEMGAVADAIVVAVGSGGCRDRPCGFRRGVAPSAQVYAQSHLSTPGCACR